MSRARLLHAGTLARTRLRTALLAPGFWARMLQLNVGLVVMGLGLATMLEAGVGLGPWAVFHEGLALQSGLTFGRILQLVGVAVLVLSWLSTGERPGPGTFLNMALVGPWVDLFRAGAWLPSPDGLAWGMAQFFVAVVLVGVSSGLYITAGLGAGPRDGLALGLARVLRLQVRTARTLIELTVLAIGWLMGGAVGVGTVLFAFLVGPAMQLGIRLFRRPAAG